MPSKKDKFRKKAKIQKTGKQIKPAPSKAGKPSKAKPAPSKAGKPSKAKPAPSKAGKPSKAKPAPSKAPAAPVMGKLQLEKFKKIISLKRGEILEIIKQKKHADLTDADVGDEIDTASRSLEKEILFELTNNEKAVLDSIEGALRKIDNNTFGICESCGRKITNKRLHIMPWARYCISCQKKYEKPE
jgi:DnaK suppressor protein